MEYIISKFEQFSGQIFISMGAYKGMSVEEAINASEKAGIKNIELSSGARYTSPDLLRMLSPYISKGMLFLIHNYFPLPEKPFVLNLASNDKENLDRSIEHCRKAIDLSSQLNAPFYSIHSGFCINTSPTHLGKKLKGRKIPVEEGLDIFIKSSIELADYALGKNVSLVIENNVASASNLDKGTNNLLLGVTEEDLIDIVQKVNRKNFGILLDVAHLKVSANSLDFDPEITIKKISPWVVACHLSDNNGLVDSNEKITLDSWFWEPLTKYLTHPPVWVLEVYNLDITSIVNQISIINSSLNSLKPSFLSNSQSH